MFNDEDNLVENVASLRSRLQSTETQLQSLGELLSQSGHDGLSERSDPSPAHGLARRLTVEDLRRPDDLQLPQAQRCQERVLSRTTDRRISPPASDSRSSSGRLVAEMEAGQLKQRLGFLRQENASLMQENQQLLSDLQAAQLEVASSRTKVRLLGTTVGAKASSVSVMKEQILGLEAEVEAQIQELRAAELRADQSLQAAAQSDRQVSELTEELSTLRTQLADRTKQGKRAEQQRNQALRNAEKLTDAFKEYKANVSRKLQKVLDSESKLKESLIQCDRERESLWSERGTSRLRPSAS
ncbi:coiled-coil domain-containing protein 18-like [Osmerus mordax]|uniref:coiled-coil domain-containing protein 18-like n=1 Tax=Osmerus mordax TaxID=8014 RepID=UPI00350FE3BE